MKLIKACVRTKLADQVIHALEKLGIPCLNAIDVKVVGAEMRDEEAEEISMEYGTEYAPMTKLEVLCHDKDTEKIVKTIKENAHTGRSGDGMIVISAVDEVIKIHSGEIERNERR